MPGRNLNDRERRLKERWESGYGPSLRTIEISNAPLRGLENVTIDFRYPLTVLAGKNGVGKSTLLACAACAYKGTTGFDSFFLKKKYFHFTDFFFTGWGDNRIRDVLVTWTYRDRDGTVRIEKAEKGPSRWRGYSKRPERAVDFVGTIRALHPCELRVLRRHFGANTIHTPTSLGDEHRTAVSQILSKNYDDVHSSSSGRYTLHHLTSGGTRYSAFNAGSGEDIACCMSRILDRLPNDSLLVIEEIETGLHPAAQRNLVKHLLQLCWSKRIQVVCSSHSAAILESVPAEARVLLVRHGPTLQARYAVTVPEAVSDLQEVPVAELVVYVEDEVALALLQEALPAQLRTRVRIVTCGSWEDVIRFLATFRRDTDLGSAIAVLDGDRDGQNNEHESAFRRHLGGNIDDDDMEWLRERMTYLPGAVPPEQWLNTLGSEEEFRETVASEVNAERHIIDGFFSAPTPENHHSLPYRLSQRIGTDAARALTALVSAAVTTKADDFESIVDFVRSHLDGGR